MASFDDNALSAEVFDKTPSAFIVLDNRGFVRKANTAAHHLLNEENLIGRRWVEVIEAVFRPKPTDGHEISTRDGRLLQVSTLALSHGQLVQMTDLTYTRKMQDKLSHMERLSSLGKMAASLAHQIRTPLSAAMLYGANLANQKLSEESRAGFQKKLMSRLQDLEAQVSDILMFARSGEQTVTHTDAVEILEQTAQTAAIAAQKAHAELIVELPQGPMPILANTCAIGGAVSNLVNNAIESGASLVKLSLKKAAGKAVIAVANDGPVIEPAVRQKIFEPFFTSKSRGTGLGLAVVSAVAKVHQGTIELKSDEEFATIFELTLPLIINTPKKKKMEVRRKAAPSFCKEKAA